MSVFDAVYEVIQLQRLGLRSRRAEKAVTDELLAALLLSPVYFADARAPLSMTAYASDATTTRGAIVRAELTPEEAACVWSCTPRRGCYSNFVLSTRRTRR